MSDTLDEDGYPTEETLDRVRKWGVRDVGEILRADWRPALSFTVRAKPVGYYVRGKKPNWTRLNAYVDYKKLVQAIAKELGANPPLKATKERPILVHTKAYFADGNHPDPENVCKGICDALFCAPKGKRGSADKHTGGGFAPPLYDKDNPRVEVTIEVRNDA